MNSSWHAISGLLHAIEIIDYRKFLWIAKKNGIIFKNVIEYVPEIIHCCSIAVMKEYNHKPSREKILSGSYWEFFKGSHIFEKGKDRE